MNTLMQIPEIQNQIGHLQNDLLDNIKYAVNIQSAILPTERKLKSLCEDSFIIYHPQRFVSGDFYWIENHQNKLSIVLGDSTGHGVSASYISLIVMSALELLKKENNHINNPKMVLEYLNNHLYTILKKDNGTRIFDSADMASFSLDFEKKKLTYTSAGITIYTVYKGEILQLNKNKLSVGANDSNSFELENHTHHLRPGERIYIMSDGMRDQQGGLNGKKLGSKKLRDLLIKTSFLGTTTQKHIIDSYLNSWSLNHEQTDDISLIGIAMPQ